MSQHGWLQIPEFKYNDKLTLPDLFEPSLIGRRDTVALEFQGTTYTFGELDARSNRLAQLFQARGLKTGDRLCVYLANSVEMIDLYLASVKLGLIFVPINILYRDREITHILTDAAPSAVVGLPAGWSISELIKEHPLIPTSARTSHSLPTPPPESSTPPGPRELPKALFLRTTISPPMHSRFWTPGRSQAKIGCCSRCRSSTYTGSAMDCIPGSRVAAGCACWNVSIIRKSPVSFSASRPRCSSACRPCTSGCSMFPHSKPADRGRHAAFRIRLRSPDHRKHSESSARTSATPSWSATV